MLCWKCGFKMDDPEGKLPFRAQCDQCFTWLHACVNCKNYQPGLPNCCKIPDTDFVADRESFNFCEFFNLIGTGPKQKGNDVTDVSKKLFGEDVEKPKRNFDDLF